MIPGIASSAYSPVVPVHVASVSRSVQGYAYDGLGTLTSSSWQVGDMLVATTTTFATETITPPAGWTTVYSAANRAIYTRTVQGSDPTSYTWAFSGTAFANRSLNITGVRNGSVVDVFTTTGGTSRDASNIATNTCAAITPTLDGLLIVHYGWTTSVAISTPSGFTSHSSFNSGAGGAQAFTRNASAGSTYAASVTSSAGTSGEFRGLQIQVAYIAP